MRPVVHSIGGFLGAGKTTTIHRLMMQSDVRTGVVVNDFGALNIDEALIASRGGNVVGLTNGCVCCTIGDDLGGALARLCAVASGLQRIFVETSGVSDPRKTAQIVALEATVTPGRVVTVVNAYDFPTVFKDNYLHDTLKRQIVRADYIMLSHVDVAPEPSYNKTLDALQELGIGCARIVLGGQEDETCFTLSTDSTFAGESEQSRVQGMFHCEEPGPTARQAPPFWQWHWGPDAEGDQFPMSQIQLEHWLASLPPEIVRVKGVVRLLSHNHYSVVHKVGQRHLFSTLDAPPFCGLVVIGRYPSVLARNMGQEFKNFIVKQAKS
ncbi:MAG: GTP-binding protein [Acetobacter malorum]|uniref:CobW family GTP-binding protein n=1 Tax=Acetobacter malorum TaxID=178901 RepID=UPI0039EAA7C3